MLVRKGTVGLITLLVAISGFSCTNSDSRKPVPAQVKLTESQRRTSFWMNKYFEGLRFSDEQGLNKQSGKPVFSYEEIQNMVNEILKTDLTHDEITQNLDQFIEDLNKNDFGFEKAKNEMRERVANIIFEASGVASEEDAPAESSDSEKK